MLAAFSDALIENCRGEQASTGPLSRRTGAQFSTDALCSTRNGLTVVSLLRLRMLTVQTSSHVKRHFKETRRTWYENVGVPRCTDTGKTDFAMPNSASHLNS